MPNNADKVLSAIDGALTADAEQEAWVEGVSVHVDNMRALRSKKFAALFAHFKIADGDWRALAIALANKHVRGFQKLPKQSRPAEWSLTEHLELFFAVQNSAPDTKCRKRERLQNWRASSRGNPSLPPTPSQVARAPRAKLLNGVCDASKPI